MKKLSIIRTLFSLLMLLGSTELWAGITWDESTQTLTLASPFDMNDFNNNYATQASRTKRLVIVGAAPDWAQIRGKFTENTLEEIDMTNMTINSDGTCYSWPGKDNAYGKIKTLKLPTGLKEISTSAFEQLGELTSVTIPSSVEIIGEKAFSDCVKLNNIVFTAPPSVHTFKSNCFQRTAFTSFTFPTSIKLIQENAFNECYGLTTMTFPSGISDLVIKGGNAEGGAFSNCTNITDVYIETENEIICEVNTYPWRITYGQGDAGAHFATLHFPPSQADYYTNLQHTLTIDVASDPGRFHDWLMEHVQQAVDNASSAQSGWWQFINAGPDEKNPPSYPLEGKFLRTFSDPDFARIVPNGVKAYIVTGVVPKTLGDTKYFEVSLNILSVIPRNTGVILFGEPNAISKDGRNKILTMPVVGLCESKLSDNYDENGNLITSAGGDYLPDGTVVRNANKEIVRTVDLSYRRKNWGDLEEQDVYHKNYLEPSTTGNATQTHLQPCKVEYDGVAYRYFGFNHYKKSATGKKDPRPATEYDYAGFFRCKDSNIGPGKAYLKLAADEYTDPEGGEVIIPSSCQTIKYKVYADNYDPDSNPDAYTLQEVYYKDEYETGKGWVVWDEETSPYWKNAEWTDLDMFGVRDSIEEQAPAKGIFDGEVEIIENLEEGVATMIIRADTEDSDEGDYYTLQGVKVNHPSKGVYIVNGKKVVVK